MKHPQHGTLEFLLKRHRIDDLNIHKEPPLENSIGEGNESMDLYEWATPADDVFEQKMLSDLLQENLSAELNALLPSKPHPEVSEPENGSAFVTSSHRSCWRGMSMTCESVNSFRCSPIIVSTIDRSIGRET
jgi:hypothetical protein